MLVERASKQASKAHPKPVSPLGGSQFAHFLSIWDGPANISGDIIEDRGARLEAEGFEDEGSS